MNGAIGVEYLENKIGKLRENLFLNMLRVTTLESRLSTIGRIVNSATGVNLGNYTDKEVSAMNDALDTVRSIIERGKHL